MNKNEQYMAEKIRTQYTAREYTELDKLRALDAKVKRPALRLPMHFLQVLILRI